MGSDPAGPDPAAALPAGQVRQATVRSFDPDRRAGSLLADDGSVLEFGAGAFGASGLRLLRPGQRVTIRLAPGGVITALTLITFPLPAAGGEAHNHDRGD
ncbi:MAG: hypothetical protein J2P35_24150 [Actinobacteria bacterium]|nr:hypothetical protein [Actinomycetota bacterium]MBO0786005.1 hypothetical protein [Actinomycetota bacterium]